MRNIELKNYLCLDVCTRWSYTYEMLNIAKKFDGVFEKFDEDLSFKIDLEYMEYYIVGIFS